MKKILLLVLLLSVGVPQQPKMNEIITETHNNGLKKVISVFQGDGIKETLVGKYGFYDDESKKFIELYRNNKKHGQFFYWYQNGQKRIEGTFKDGKLDGIWIHWYQNGQKDWEGIFKNGEDSGKWTYWYDDGREIVTVILEFISVEGGEFDMGSATGDGDENQKHRVRLSDFSISKTEVTFKQYDVFCDATGRQKPDDEGWGRGDRPVINVTWHDARDFCEWLSRQIISFPYNTDKVDEFMRFYSSSDSLSLGNLVLVPRKTVRLPTEAEWEYAARGGNKSKGYKYSGSNSHDVDVVAWFDGDETHPVAQKQSNELGLYDMSGNVWEWCADWYGNYSISPKINPKGLVSSDYRVLRGGSWGSLGSYCRVTNRGRNDPDVENYSIGFRCVLSDLDTQVGMMNDEFITGVLTSVTVDSTPIAVRVWDHAVIDDDQIDLIVNGNYILEDFTLSGEPGTIVNLTLNPGDNSFIIHADNVGYIPPNTASIEISNVTSGASNQIYKVGMNENAIMTINCSTPDD